jgi:hypothetical protein
MLEIFKQIATKKNGITSILLVMYLVLVSLCNFAHDLTCVNIFSRSMP